jgi:hypothetical protein
MAPPKLKDFMVTMHKLGETATLVDAVGQAGLRAQDKIRQNLEAMIYSQPPAASGYVRTRTLYRSAHSAPIGADHSGDEATASAGGDLAKTTARSVVGVQGTQIGFETGAWVRYADAVEAGANQPEERPFTPSQEEVSGWLEEEVLRAVLAAAGRRK